MDRQTVRKLTIMQTKAIEAFITHRNSSASAGKVTLDEISKYMTEGPGEDTLAPALSEDLRVHIPRSSLRYVLIHCLGYVIPMEPPLWASFLDGTGDAKAKAPTTGEPGTVYCKGGNSKGPTSDELAIATVKWLKENYPKALDSKVERTFREKGWKIIWTPPYAPK